MSHLYRCKYYFLCHKSHHRCEAICLYVIYRTRYEGEKSPNLSFRFSIFSADHTITAKAQFDLKYISRSKHSRTNIPRHSLSWDIQCLRHWSRDHNNTWAWMRHWLSQPRPRRRHETLTVTVQGYPSIKGRHFDQTDIKILYDKKTLLN